MNDKGTAARMSTQVNDNFEERLPREFELACFKHDNTTTLADQVKVAILLNETIAPLQQQRRVNI